MNASLGVLKNWVRARVRQGDYSNESELIREAVLRMKEAQPSEPSELQKLIDEAEDSNFEELTAADWKELRHMAKVGLSK